MTQAFQDWEYNLTNHTPTPEGIKIIEDLRAKAKDYVQAVLAATPPCREQSVALTHFEIATFYVNASIARYQNNDPRPSERHDS